MFVLAAVFMLLMFWCGFCAWLTAGHNTNGHVYCFSPSEPKS